MAHAKNVLCIKSDNSIDFYDYMNEIKILHSPIPVVMRKSDVIWIIATNQWNCIGAIYTKYVLYESLFVWIVWVYVLFVCSHSLHSCLITWDAENRHDNHKFHLRKINCDICICIFSYQLFFCFIHTSFETCFEWLNNIHFRHAFDQRLKMQTKCRVVNDHRCCKSPLRIHTAPFRRPFHGNFDLKSTANHFQSCLEYSFGIFLYIPFTSFNHFIVFTKDWCDPVSFK